MILKIFLIVLLAGSAAANESESDSDLFSDTLFSQEESIDPESIEGDYDERVKAMQKWLWRREAERKIQGLSLEEPKPDDTNIFTSKYFEERGYDERGYKRLDGNVHVKLRHQPLIKFKEFGHSKKTDSKHSIKEEKPAKPAKKSKAIKGVKAQGTRKPIAKSPAPQKPEKHLNSTKAPVKTAKQEKPVKKQSPVKGKR